MSERGGETGETSGTSETSSEYDDTTSIKLPLLGSIKDYKGQNLDDDSEESDENIGAKGSKRTKKKDRQASRKDEAKSLEDECKYCCEITTEIPDIRIKQAVIYLIREGPAKLIAPPFYKVGMAYTIECLNNLQQGNPRCLKYIHVVIKEKCNTAVAIATVEKAMEKNGFLKERNSLEGKGRGGWYKVERDRRKAFFKIFHESLQE